MNSMAMEILLGGTLVILAIRLLWASDLFEGIVLFIVFGLVLTLVWAWLGAADVALAEAAIGAGLTGALLLAAWRNAAKRLDSAEKRRGTSSLSGSLVAAVVGAALGVVLQISLGDPVEGSIGLSGRVAEALPRSGVASPITAVLLNFRAYDTFLEVGVLLAAWVAAVGPLAPSGIGGDVDASETEGILSTLGRFWVPLVLLVSAYVLWAGSRWPGGAFQSAALLAGTAILLDLVGLPIPIRQHPGLRAIVPVGGFAAFGFAAAVGLLGRGKLLAFPEGQADWWIPAIELATTISLAAVLFLLYRAVLSKRGGSS